MRERKTWHPSSHSTVRMGTN